MTNQWGTFIERGSIHEVGGSHRYRVKSLDRNGVLSPWLEPLDNPWKITVNTTHDIGGQVTTQTLTANAEPEPYEKGDMVYFFLFPDGHGAILGRIH